MHRVTRAKRHHEEDRSDVSSDLASRCTVLSWLWNKVHCSETVVEHDVASSREDIRGWKKGQLQKRFVMTVKSAPKVVGEEKGKQLAVTVVPGSPVKAWTSWEAAAKEMMRHQKPEGSSEGDRTAEEIIRDRP